MTITLFNNFRGLVHGKFADIIAVPFGGTLKIGDSIVRIKARTKTELPLLCDGQTGEFEATFTDEYGKVYTLFNVNLVDGRIVPPSAELEELGRLYKKANAYNPIIEQYIQQKQEAINALNKHPLKSLIE